MPFLVAAPGLAMLFGLVPVSPSDRQDMTTARRWLVAALEEYGAGAKTALGYGQFHVRPEHPLFERMEKERVDGRRWRLRKGGGA